MRMLIASEHERLFLECYCASRWHHRRHCRERKLRYVAVFWAALRQLNIYRVSGGKHKEQVEKLGAEYLLIDWAWSLGELSPQGARAIAYHLPPNSAVSARGTTRNSRPLVRLGPVVRASGGERSTTRDLIGPHRSQRYP